MSQQDNAITTIPVSSYNTEKSVYVGSELFNVRYNLSAVAQKVLFTLAQRLTPSDELFPLWTIDIRTLFECCGLGENNNKRYAIIRDALEEIGSNPLKRMSATDEEWESVYWFDKFAFSKSRSMNVHIMFGHSIKEYLLQLNKYVEIKPTHFRNLGNYAMYLYPMLKNQLYLSKKFSKYEAIFDKEIAYLKQFTCCDSLKCYEDNTKFLNNVIGIQRGKDDKWMYSTKKSGEKEYSISPIKEISDKTDIIVSAEPLKDGKSYAIVRFTVMLKTDAIEARRLKNADNAAKDNQAKAEVRKERKRPDVEVVDKRHQTVLLKEATEAGMSIESYAKLAGYVRRGEWYLLFAKKEPAKTITQLF